MDCTLVIVTWNNERQIQRCLDSVFKTKQSVSFEVFVVDNASRDKTVHLIQSYGNAVTLIRNKTNRGFATACNQALRQATGDYCILLNPDTCVRDASLDQTVSFFGFHPEAGIMGPRLVFPDGKDQWSVRRFPDVFSHVIMLTKIHNFFPHVATVQHYLAADFDYRKTAVVDQVMGAYFAFRRSLISQIGLLDERFYIWYEEVDYCFHALRQGWKTYYNSSMTVAHEKGASFGQRKTFALQLIMSRSMLHYFSKNIGIISASLLLPFMGINILLAGLQTIFNIRKTERNL